MNLARRIAALRRLAELAMDSGDNELVAIGAELAAWMMLDGDGSLESALGIANQQSQPNWRITMTVEKRNEALRTAARLFGLKPKALATAMNRYYTSSWRADRTAETCPLRLIGTLQEQLWRALKAKAIPLKERAIRDVIGDLGSEQGGLTAANLNYTGSGNDEDGPGEGVQERDFSSSRQQG